MSGTSRSDAVHRGGWLATFGKFAGCWLVAVIEITSKINDLQARWGRLCVALVAQAGAVIGRGGQGLVWKAPKTAQDRRKPWYATPVPEAFE